MKWIVSLAQTKWKKQKNNLITFSSLGRGKGLKSNSKVCTLVNVVLSVVSCDVAVAVFSAEAPCASHSYDTEHQHPLTHAVITLLLHFMPGSDYTNPVQFWHGHLISSIGPEYERREPRSVTQSRNSVVGRSVVAWRCIGLYIRS